MVSIHKRTIGWAAVACTLTLITGCSLGQVTATAPPKGPYQVVQVTAHDFAWKLSTTHLKMGETVKFIVQSDQDVHGFSVMGTNISNSVAAGDPPTVVYWTPPAAGTYTVACNVYCGVGHNGMVTEFTVR